MKEVPIVSKNLAKKPMVEGKGQREEVFLLCEGSALEPRHSASQPNKKPKLSKHLIFVTRVGEDLIARFSKVFTVGF